MRLTRLQRVLAIGSLLLFVYLVCAYVASRSRPLASFLYHQAYGSRSFPFWFLASAVWYAHLVYYSCSFSRNSHFNSFWKLIWSFFLTFLPNELIALKTRSPTTLTPQALLAFALVYVAFQFGPRDIAFEFSSETIELFGFLHGFNQFRTFARWLPSPAAFLLGLLDVLVEPGFRVPLKFVEAPGAGVFVVLRTAVVLGVYLAVRLGVGQSKTLDLLFGTALALLNVFTWQTKELLRKAAGRLLRGRNWSPFHVPATGG